MNVKNELTLLRLHLSPLTPNSGGTGMESPPELEDLAAFLFGGSPRIKNDKTGENKLKTELVRLLYTRQPPQRGFSSQQLREHDR